MAQSFWSRRRDTIDNASSYMRATETVSRPTAVLMGMLAVFAVVAILLGVFWGARLAYSKITGRDTASTSQTTSDVPKTTITSSTVTTDSNAKTDTGATTASTSPVTPPVATTPPKSISNTGPTVIPNTGPTSLID